MDTGIGLAVRKHQERQANKPKHKSVTAQIQNYVEGLIKQDDSPEQIAGIGQNLQRDYFFAHPYFLREGQ